MRDPANAPDDTDEFDGDVTTDEPATAVPDPRDRRLGPRRRGAERRGERSGTGPADRRSDERRQNDRRQDKAIPPLYRAGERRINEYPLSAEELEFINAMNAYKHAHDRPFPTWSEVLHVLRALGYSRSSRALRPGESDASDASDDAGDAPTS